MDVLEENLEKCTWFSDWKSAVDTWESMYKRLSLNLKEQDRIALINAVRQITEALFFNAEKLTFVFNPNGMIRVEYNDEDFLLSSLVTRFMRNLKRAGFPNVARMAASALLHWAILFLPLPYDNDDTSPAEGCARRNLEELKELRLDEKGELIKIPADMKLKTELGERGLVIRRARELKADEEG